MGAQFTGSGSGYATRQEFVGGKLTYVGSALPRNQQLIGAACWQIQKLTYSGDELVSVTFANGSAEFAFVWDNRADYIY